MAQKAFGIIWFWWAKRFLKLKVQGLPVFETAQKPILLVSNHTGVLDAFLINMAVPAKFKLVRTLGADWLFKNKGLKFFLESLGAVQICRTDPHERFSDPNKERAAKLANLIDYAKRDQTVLMFPQGRITPEEKFGDCRKGAAEMILAIPELTVVPIAVQGTQNLLFQTSPEPGAQTKYGLLAIRNRLKKALKAQSRTELGSGTGQSPDSQKLRLNLKNLWNFCGERARGVTITFSRPLDYRYLADKNQRNKHVDEETLRVVLTNEIKYKLIKIKKAS